MEKTISQFNTIYAKHSKILSEFQEQDALDASKYQKHADNYVPPSQEELKTVCNDKQTIENLLRPHSAELQDFWSRKENYTQKDIDEFSDKYADLSVVQDFIETLASTQWTVRKRYYSDALGCTSMAGQILDDMNIKYDKDLFDLYMSHLQSSMINSQKM